MMGSSDSKLIQAPSPPPPSSSSSSSSSSAAAAAVESVTGGLERMTLEENPDAAVIPREDTVRCDEDVPRVDTVRLEDVQPTGWDEDEKPTGWEEDAKSEKNSRVVPSKDGKGEHLQRPRERDCWFYVNTGSCRFGSNCKFNHPPRRNRNRPKFKKSSDSEPIQSRERKKGPPSEKVEKAEYKAGNGKQDKTHSGWKGRTEGKAAVEKESPSGREGRTECKYYAMPGGSKFGKSSEHGPLQEKTQPDPVELNFLGLPIRPDKRECPYYMRTGGCKFAINCWYHHPNPTAVAVQDTLSGYQNSASLQQHASGASVVPMMTSSEPVPIFDAPPSYNPPQGFYPNLEWNGYQVPATPWLSPDMSRTDITAHQQVQVDEYPERPGQPACDYFMKNGDCKFKSACKFHHPKTRLQKCP